MTHNRSERGDLDGAFHPGSSVDASLLGEGLSFPERLLVAPAPGVIHRRRVRVGRHLDPGVVLADLRSDGATIKVGSPVRGTFVNWVVDEGERVNPGRVLARILPDAPGEFA